IFWKRLGTPLPIDFHRMPNGERYPSGSVYEVLTAIEARNRDGADRPEIYVFQKTEAPTFGEDELDHGKEQLRLLREFFAGLHQAGRGSQTFATSDDFAQQLEKLLRGWIEKHIAGRWMFIWPSEKGSPFRAL